VHKTAARASPKREFIAAALLGVLGTLGASASAETGVAASAKQEAQAGAEAGGQTDAQIAMAALNPVAAMYSLPLEYNYDHEIGPQEDGHKNYINVQPVLPFSIGEDWNLISRTIIPLIDQEDIFPGAGSQSGIGDITQSFFFSPKSPTDSGWIWGAGPVLYLSTASDELLGAEKYGAGPTAVFLKQTNGWTFGALLNQIWSFAGNGNRADINSMYMQPFVSYTTKSLTTFAVNSESSYNWDADRDPWTVPINLMATQFFKVGKQRLTLRVGARYWADSPDSGAHGWGGRVTLTFLFPVAKK
jgi:hypothetical protein